MRDLPSILMLYCSEFNKSNIIQDHKCLLIFIICVYGLDVIMGGHSYTFLYTGTVRNK